jgi:hypothetical protein
MIFVRSEIVPEISKVNTLSLSGAPETSKVERRGALPQVVYLELSLPKAWPLLNLNNFGCRLPMPCSRSFSRCFLRFGKDSEPTHRRTLRFSPCGISFWFFKDPDVVIAPGICFSLES